MPAFAVPFLHQLFQDSCLDMIEMSGDGKIIRDERRCAEEADVVFEGGSVVGEGHEIRSVDGVTSALVQEVTQFFFSELEQPAASMVDDEQLTCAEDIMGNNQ